MKNELLLKLKEAGYPLEKVIEPTDIKRIVDVGTIDVGPDDYYVPILEELIRECGDISISIVYNAIFKTWKAYDSDDVSEDCITVTEGSTAAIAVANLWLALQGKQ